MENTRRVVCVCVDGWFMDGCNVCMHIAIYYICACVCVYIYIYYIYKYVCIQVCIYMYVCVLYTPITCMYVICLPVSICNISGRHVFLIDYEHYYFPLTFFIGLFNFYQNNYIGEG